MNNNAVQFYKPSDGFCGAAEAEAADEYEVGRRELRVERGSFSLIFISTASSPSGKDARYSFSKDLFLLRGDELGFSVLSAWTKYPQ